MLLFRGLKRELGVIDFGDQITLALRVIEEHPEAAEDYRSRYLAVVLDEYQDTNVAQADMIAGLFGGGFPVTAVGDPDQSIYGWRGASLFNLLEFQAQFPRADGTPSGSSRCTRTSAPGPGSWAPRIESSASSPPSSVRTRTRRWCRGLRAARASVELARFADEWSEAQWVAERVAEVHAEGRSPRGPRSPCCAGAAGCSSRCRRRWPSARCPRSSSGWSVC